MTASILQIKEQGNNIEKQDDIDDNFSINFSNDETK